MRRSPLTLAKAHLHRTGLLPRLLLAEAALLALLVATSLVLVGRLADSVQASQNATWLRSGQSTGVALDGMLTDARGDLRTSAAWYREARQPDAAQRVLDLTATNAPLFTQGIVVVGPDHRVRAADAHHPRLLGANLTATWLATIPVDGTGGVVWTAAGSRRARKSVALAVPLDPTQSGGVLVGLIGDRGSAIAHVLAQVVRRGQSGHAELVDRDCRVLFATEPVLSAGEDPAFCRAMWPRGQAGIGEAAAETPLTADRRGTHLMAFVPLRTLPWALEMDPSTSAASEPANQLRVDSVGILLGFTALALLATIVVGRKVVEPVTSLSAVARRIAEGERTAEIRTPWGGEIGELARSLETMRVRLADWALALEEQVRARTSELEQRNQELGDLYLSLRQQEAQRQTLLGRILGAQEDERRRVSRELHDSIGQTFWALTLGLERLQNRDDCPAGLRAELASLQQLAADSLADLRRLTVALRPAALDDLGLVPAIRRYAELYLSDAGIACEIAADGLGERLDPFLETVVYRVVQEAINNVARHSGATRAEITLRRVAGALQATVVDNGRGFDRARREPGVGLQGMDERALLVGGKLSVTSTPGGGTTVSLTVPLGSTTPGGQDGREKAVAG